MQPNDKTPLSDAALERWPLFTEAVHKRLVAGKETYGDSSFKLPLLSLIEEIDQELMDVAGWSWVLHERIVALKAKIQQLDSATQSAISNQNT